MPKQKTFCTIDGCGKPCVGNGMCRAHYNRWYRHGDPRVTKKVYRLADKCSVKGCEHAPIAKGLCQNHYALKKRHGTPERKRVFTGEYIKDGYKYVRVGHRHYEPEHRLVMEKMLGRKLQPAEHVHHIDENTLNNSPSNLQIVSRSEHLKLHIAGRPRGKNGHFVKG